MCNLVSLLFPSVNLYQLCTALMRRPTMGDKVEASLSVELPYHRGYKPLWPMEIVHVDPPRFCHRFVAAASNRLVVSGGCGY